MNFALSPHAFLMRKACPAHLSWGIISLVTSTLRRITWESVQSTFLKRKLSPQSSGGAGTQLRFLLWPPGRLSEITSMCILSRQSPSCHPVPHPVIHPHACTHAQSASAIYLCLHSTSVPRSIHSSFTPSRSEKGTFFLSFFFCVFFCLLFCVHFFFFFSPLPLPLWSWYTDSNPSFTLTDCLLLLHDYLPQPLPHIPSCS